MIQAIVFCSMVIGCLVCLAVSLVVDARRAHRDDKKTSSTIVGGLDS